MTTLPSLHRLWATRVTGGEPGINFVLEIIDQTWPAAMVRRTRFDHTPLRQCRTADADIKGCFPGPQARFPGDHSVHLGDRDSLGAKVAAIPIQCLVIQLVRFPNWFPKHGMDQANAAQEAWIKQMVPKHSGF